MAGLDEERSADPDFGGLTQLANVQLFLGAQLPMADMGHGHLRGQTGRNVPIRETNGRCRLGEGSQGAQTNPEHEKGTEHFGAQWQGRERNPIHPKLLLQGAGLYSSALPGLYTAP